MAFPKRLHTAVLEQYKIKDDRPPIMGFGTSMKGEWHLLYSTVFAQLSTPCGCKLGNFSVTGVLSNIPITAPPNECRSGCYVRQQEMADRWQLQSPYIYLFVVLKQKKFNMGRRSLALAGTPKSVKNCGGGGCAYLRQCV